jgi:hypothetical protein
LAELHKDDLIHEAYFGGKNDKLWTILGSLAYQYPKGRQVWLPKAVGKVLLW